jgi:hypothetical protein
LHYLVMDYVPFVTKHLPPLLASVRGAETETALEAGAGGKDKDKRARTVFDHGFRAADNACLPAALAGARALADTLLAKRQRPLALLKDGRNLRKPREGLLVGLPEAKQGVKLAGMRVVMQAANRRCRE